MGPSPYPPYQYLSIPIYRKRGVPLLPLRLGWHPPPTGRSFANVGVILRLTGRIGSLPVSMWQLWCYFEYGLLVWAFFLCCYGYLWACVACHRFVSRRLSRFGWWAAAGRPSGRGGGRDCNREFVLCVVIVCWMRLILRLCVRVARLLSSIAIIGWRGR